MKVTTGDIWTTEDDVIVIPTNPVVNKLGKLVMGRGLARQARDKYPGVDAAWGDRDERIFITPDHKELYRFVVNTHWRNPADLGIIKRSLVDMVAWYADDSGGKYSLPVVGCGEGMLCPSVVIPMLEYFLDDRFTLWLWAEEARRHAPHT